MKSKRKIPSVKTAMFALAACDLLVLAYIRGQENGASVDWNDVDVAYEAARQALSQAHKEGLDG